MEIILLMDNETDYNISEDFFISLAESALKNKKINYPLQTAEISLVLTDDNEMQEINKLYRKIDKTTDVLSFPINEGKNISSKMLGDIVISIDRMKSQAIEMDVQRRKSWRPFSYMVFFIYWVMTIERRGR